MDQDLLLEWHFKGRTIRFPLAQTSIIIGRGRQCDLNLENHTVSRRHARIFWDNGRYMIKDVGSSFGTMLNGRKLEKGQTLPLLENAEIRLGEQTVLCIPNQIRDAVATTQTLHPFSASHNREELKLIKRKISELCLSYTAQYPDLSQLHRQVDHEIERLVTIWEQRLSEHEVLHETAYVINKFSEPDKVFNESIRLISRVIHVDRAFLFYQPGGGELFCSAKVILTESGADAEKARQQALNIARLSLQKRMVMLREDIHAMQDSGEEEVSPLDALAGSFVCIPLVRKEVTLGVVYLEHGNLLHSYGREHRDFFRIYALQIAGALYNIQIYNQATTDDLTGLYSRKYMEVKITEEMRRARRYRQPCSLAILDLDHFKAVNDNQGHCMGDDVLRAVANVLANTLRTVDFAGRYGGDEFLILLINTDLEKAGTVCRRVVKKIRELPLETQPTVTASIGIADYQNRFGEECVAFMQAADEELYRVKNSGGDDVGPS